MFNKGFFYALATAIMFSTMGIFTKFIYRYGAIDANLLFFSSSLFGMLFLLIILLMKYKNFSFLKIGKKDLKLSFLSSGLFGLFLGNLTVLKSLQYVDVSIQKIITYSNPLFIILINNLIFGKKLNKNNVINVFLMLLGLILIVGKLNFSGENILIGVMFAVASAVFVAIYSISSENNHIKTDQAVYWFYAFFSSFIYITIFLIYNNKISDIQYIFTINYKLLFLLFIIAIFNFVLPYLSFYKAILKIGAEKTSIILTTAPVLSILLSVIMLGERLSISQIIGSVFIITASLLSGLKK